DGEFTARLLYALAGTALVAMPLLLRSRLGNLGALITSVMLAFSPAMLYFSRFARNDILVAAWTFGLVIVMWRYIDERKNRWLHIGAGIIALGFTTKETQYIVIALLIAFLITQVWREIRDWLYARKSLNEFSPSASFLVLIATLTLPLCAAGIAIFQKMAGITLAAEDGVPGLVTGSPDGTGWVVAVGVSVILLAACLWVGWYWNRRVFFSAWAVFAVIFVLIFTNIGSNPGGVGSGAWQSLGYWLAQQDVARGSQPWYYYFTLGAIYEFMPLAVAGISVIYYGFRSGIRPWICLLLIAVGMIILANDGLSFQRGIIKTEEQDILSYVGKMALLLVYVAALATPFVLKTSKFNRFLIFWMIGTFIAYTHAGEKMPWLIVNIVLPLII
ncbi:MAG: TIGR03663 family protein, partial [Gammaproteobacteria bacterium]|nr:TIGR03663 family protein [Gammaproteobacteria bacterium]